MSILYVVSKNEKHLLLEYKKSNPFLNFDIILDDELRSSFYGVLNNSAITYLKNLGFSYFNAEKIANTTLLLKDLDFEITYKTVDGLQNRINIKDIYQEFENRNYISKNKYLDLYLKNREIVLSPMCDNEEIKWLLKDYNYRVESIKEIVNSRVIYKSKTLVDSCMLLYSLIANEYENNIDLKKIKIASSSDEFVNILKAYNRFYNFPICFVKSIKKNKLKGYKKLFELLKTKSLKDSLEELKDDELIKEFISIYITMKDHCSEEEIIDYLKYYANGNVKLKDNGAIEFVDKYYIPKKDEVLFVPSFISSIYPSPVSDDSYPGDKEFGNAHILTSNQRNDLELVSFKEMYHAQGRVIFLSYEKHNKNEYIDSTYKSQFTFDEKEEVESIDKQIYTNERIKNLKLSLSADYERLYGIKNPYANQIKEVDEYLSYSNAFKPFNGFVKNEKKNLSFSLMNTYLECPFKYYLQNELCLDKFEGNEVTRKGEIYHKFMQNMSSNIVEPISYYTSLLEDKKEKYLLEKGFPSVVKAQELHKEFLTNSPFTLEKVEKDIVIDINGISFKGKIDCMLVDEKKSLAIVIDYKTSNKSFEMDMLDEGESLQLPLYLLLIKKCEKNYKPIGAYISNMLSNNFLKNGDISEFKLSGITNVNYLEYLNALGYIQGVKKDKEGNYILGKKLGTDKDIDKLITIAESAVEKVYYAIENGEFTITPLEKKKADACKYCTYKDICFKEDIDEEQGDEEDE